MKKVIPEKLKIGDEIRVIAPSRSMKILGQNTVEFAKNRLEQMGFKVSFGKNVMSSVNDDFLCGSIRERVEDLHEAFKDKNVKAILTVIGGYNINQLLDYVDYDLIKENPKIFCGFSDITALSNSIYAKTGLVTYYGPHFSSFGMKYGFEYTLDYFRKMLIENKEDVDIISSDKWSNDSWYKNQEDRDFIKNDGMKIMSSGKGEGKIIGGNLCTLNLLQGTEYMPDEDNIILFLEDDSLVKNEFVREFDRDLQSLLHSLKGKNVNGIVIGKAEKEANMNENKWKEIIETKAELKDIPVIIDANFGHTTPIFTFPIGGFASIEAKSGIKIKIHD